MKVAASPRLRAQVAAVLAFVISQTTFLAAQDDETGRCPKVVFKSLVTSYSAPLIPSHSSLATHPCFQTSRGNARTHQPSLGYCI